MDGKYWWQSRSILLNGTTVILTMLAAFLEVLNNAGAVITTSTLIVGALAAINAYLRFGTSQPILRGGIAYAPGTLSEEPAHPLTVTPSPYMGVPGQATEGVAFDTAPTPPADLPTLPGKEGPHDGA